MSELLKPAEVSERLKIDRVTVYRWVKSGRLKAKRLPDGQLRIEVSEVNKLLKE